MLRVHACVCVLSELQKHVQAQAQAHMHAHTHAIQFADILRAQTFCAANACVFIYRGGVSDFMGACVRAPSES